MSETIRIIKKSLKELEELGNTREFLRGAIYGLYLSRNINKEERYELNEFLDNLFIYENITIIVSEDEDFMGTADDFFISFDDD